MIDTSPAEITFFSSYCASPHRDLPSFPTRRSSDLKRRCERGHHAGEHAPDSSRGLRDQEIVRVRGFGPGPTPVEVDQDRKSTRLNSSHQIISYAVFCLKKKRR